MAAFSPIRSLSVFEADNQTTLALAVLRQSTFSNTEPAKADLVCSASGKTGPF